MTDDEDDDLDGLHARLIRRFDELRADLLLQDVLAPPPLCSEIAALARGEVVTLPAIKDIDYHYEHGGSCGTKALGLYPVANVAMLYHEFGNVGFSCGHANTGVRPFPLGPSHYYVIDQPLSYYQSEEAVRPATLCDNIVHLRYERIKYRGGGWFHFFLHDRVTARWRRLTTTTER
jgi:hypothetical protein